MLEALRRLLKNPRTWQLALAGYWLALFVGTHIPSNMPILPSDSVDKVVHFTAFAVLATLLATTWQLAAGHLTRAPPGGRLARARGCTPHSMNGRRSLVGRDSSIWDWIADAIGAPLASALR